MTLYRIRIVAPLSHARLVICVSVRFCCNNRHRRLTSFLRLYADYSCVQFVDQFVLAIGVRIRAETLRHEFIQQPYAANTGGDRTQRTRSPTVCSKLGRQLYAANSGGDCTQQTRAVTVRSKLGPWLYAANSRGDCTQQTRAVTVRSNIGRRLYESIVTQHEVVATFEALASSMDTASDTLRSMQQWAAWHATMWHMHYVACNNVANALRRMQ